MQNSKKTLILEGNIGAGKSTFLRILQDKLNLEIVYEPTQKWQNVSSDGNILELFYKDAKRWAYTFQSYAFITRIQSILERENSFDSSSNIQVLERSVYCDRYCFAQNCFEAGFMSELEWQIYREWFSWLVENYTKKPDGFIYLKVKPEVCLERILKRNRIEEAGMKIDYLKKLHDKHENWLVKKEVSDYLKNVPVLVLDCDKDFEINQKEQDLKLNEVINFINQLEPVNILPEYKPINLQL